MSGRNHIRWMNGADDAITRPCDSSSTYARKAVKFNEFSEQSSRMSSDHELDFASRAARFITSRIANNFIYGFRSGRSFTGLKRTNGPQIWETNVVVTLWWVPDRILSSDRQWFDTLSRHLRKIHAAALSKTDQCLMIKRYSVI
jgi:hypothetical protein